MRSNFSLNSKFRLLITSSLRRCVQKNRAGDPLGSLFLYLCSIKNSGHERPVKQVQQRDGGRFEDQGGGYSRLCTKALLHR